MKRALVILLIATVHFALTLVLFLASFGAMMARFDRGEPPSAGERMVSAATEALMFPLSALRPLMPGQWFPGLWGYAPLAANSLLWGAGVSACLSWLSKK